MALHQERHSGEAAFRAVRISEHVYWVGAVDWDIRDFHGYATRRGSTYNAFLIMADKVTLIDTVKAPFFAEMMARIASIIDPADIDYVISNHAEMDHSGCLAQVIEAVQPEKVFASSFGVKALQAHFHLDREIVALKDGESLSLGNLTLSCVETRMLHWPDSMFTYLAEDELLFSSDAFGMHLASVERFDDEVSDDILDYEAGRYFANILLPFSNLVTKLLDRMQAIGMTIRVIAPDHGPVWRSKIARILAHYAQWADRRPANKAVVVYDTMWQSTATMARAIGEGLTAGGVAVVMLPLKVAHRSDVAHELLDAGALIVGSPTLNNGLFPTVADTLTYLKGLRPRKLVGAAFGSYGWSGEAVAHIRDAFAAMKIDVVEDECTVKYVPDDEALARCFALGTTVAETVKEKLMS